MAWTDQCKISAVQTIDKTVEKDGLSIRKALRKISKESEIPYSTLQKWYHPRDLSEAKNGLKRTKSQNAHWRAVERKILSAIEYVTENCKIIGDSASVETAENIVECVRRFKVIEDHYINGKKQLKRRFLNALKISRTSQKSKESDVETYVTQNKSYVKNDVTPSQESEAKNGIF